MTRDTASEQYSKRLTSLELVWWKRLLDIQRPYRWNLERLRLGFVLDVGCGIGRNLQNLRGQGVGVDHNARSVEIARKRGFSAYSPAEFSQCEYAQSGRFDSLLLSHVCEHMRREEAVQVIQQYLPFLKANGLVVLITPQEAGFKSDSSHVEFMDFQTLGDISRQLGLRVEKQYSFPFPRRAGKLFRYNEFVMVCRKTEDQV